MCLSTVDTNPTVATGTAWKVLFQISDGSSVSALQLYPMPEEKWLLDPSVRRLLSDSGNEYLTGFHLYKTRREARIFRNVRERVARVSFRRVTATGKQNDLRVVVAREIYIHPKGE